MAAAAKQNKPLSPTLKEKKRYITYRLYAQQALPANAGAMLARKLSETLGTFGAAKAGLLPIAYDAGKNTGVIRTAHTATTKVRAAMLLTTTMGNTRIVIQPMLTSGILKKAKQAM